MTPEEMRRRIEQIYRDVIATTPLSTVFTHGRLKDAYINGIDMVQEHTVKLMAQRMVEVLQEIQNEQDASGSDKER
jgi:hypothetical protein